MDVAETGDDNPGATGEAEPVCEICDAKIGIFMERGLAWRHYTGDGTTVGQQKIYDPGHAPVVTWRLPRTRRHRTSPRHAPLGAPSGSGGAPIGLCETGDVFLYAATYRS